MPFKTILQAVLIREGIIVSLKSIKSLLSKVNRKLVYSKTDYENGLKRVFNDSMNWSKTIKPFGFEVGKDTMENYIDLDYHVTLVRHQYDKQIPKKRLLKNILEHSPNHLILFGGPGMGKTTSLKMLTQRLIQADDVLVNFSPLPIVIRLRELRVNFSQEEINSNKEYLLYLFIYRLFDFKIEVEDEEKKNVINNQSLVKSIVLSLLDDLKLILLIDGFDEIDHELRDVIKFQIKDIAYKTSFSRIILTVRPGELGYNIENFDQLEIAKLTRPQILDFSKKWLGEKKSTDFIKSLDDSTFNDTAIKPLILSFLCTIYKLGGGLPAKPRFVYGEIIDLLVNRWDKDRGFGRKSKFPGFDKNYKYEFIVFLAFELTIKGKFSFSKHDLNVIYSDIYYKFNLPKDSCGDVVGEVEEHSGLFLQSGVDSFEFPHKSIQEYLAAVYLIRYSPLSDFSEKIINIPNELAIVVSLSTNSNEKLVEILKLIGQLKEVDRQVILNKFLIRLSSEKPVFEPRYTTAMEISIILNKGYNTSSDSTRYQNFLTIYNLEGIKECFVKLEDYFIYTAKDFKKISKGKQKISADSLILLEVKELSNWNENFYIYLKALENWVYISPYWSNVKKLSR